LCPNWIDTATPASYDGWARFPLLVLVVSEKQAPRSTLSRASTTVAFRTDARARARLPDEHTNTVSATERSWLCTANIILLLPFGWKVGTETEP
jgi:hypothetical protein